MGPTINSISNQSGDVIITFDPYIAFDIKNIGDQIGTPVYWMVNGSKGNLLEIGVSLENGFLSSITLVLIQPDSIHKVDSLPVSFLSCSYGLPVFNTSFWNLSEEFDFSERFVDDYSNEIQIFITSDSLLLEIGENKKATDWIRCSDNFFLGFDAERNMVNVVLNNLTQTEIELFFDAAVS